jgi:ankyrin repeat protein
MELVSTLLESIDKNRALQIACECGQKAIVQELLHDPNFHISYRGKAAIIEASEAGHLDIVNILLDDPRFDASIDENAPLMVAFEHRHYDIIIRLLLDPRVDPSDGDNMAITCCAGDGWLDLLNALLVYPNVDPSVRGTNGPLGLALQNEHFDVAERLLEEPSVQQGDLSFARRYYDPLQLEDIMSRTKMTQHERLNQRYQ